MNMWGRQWELSPCGDSTQSVVLWHSVLTMREKRKYDTNVLINLFSIRHSQGQSTLEPGREKMENGGRKGWTLRILIPPWIYLLSTFISRHCSIIKQCPFSIYTLSNTAAQYYVDKMPFWMGWNTEANHLSFCFNGVARNLAFANISPYASPGNRTEGSCLRASEGIN